MTDRCSLRRTGNLLDMRKIRTPGQPPLELGSDLKSIESFAQQDTFCPEHNHIDIGRPVICIEARIEEGGDGCRDSPIDRGRFRPSPAMSLVAPRLGAAAGVFVSQIALARHNYLLWTTRISRSDASDNHNESVTTRKNVKQITGNFSCVADHSSSSCFGANACRRYFAAIFSTSDNSVGSRNAASIDSLASRCPRRLSALEKPSPFRLRA
ncbi:hypothetical protein N2601_08740 [Rhizobium sp. CB3060]|uniref:hypothetical protein n=1 Tax=Rhizobium sp. CB3060 TaxID=3138255 RepID=UPI0021A5CB1F|nr:hypothetical protein [Rhizobium tropici]UWU23016.1 hypothetical protein N2601_08740 [Rhizobium tropici]